MPEMGETSASFNPSSDKVQRFEELASDLGPFVNVPQTQVEKYIKMQTPDTVSELRTIVRNVKSTPMPPIKSARNEDTASQSTKAKSSSTKKKVPNIDQMLASKNKMMSSYAQYFGEDELDPDYSALCKARKHGKDQGAFEKVWKPDKRDALQKWQQKASEQEVQLLANCCRGVFAVQEKERFEKSSEYKYKFQQGVIPTYERVERDRNRSEVPIGSIYTTDPWELVASAKRTKETRQRMTEVLSKQDQMMKHRTLPKEKMDLCYIDKTKMKKYRGSSDIQDCFFGGSKMTGPSEYRTNFIAH